MVRPYSRYVLFEILIIAMLGIAAAPRGASVLEVTAMLNTYGPTEAELDTFTALAVSSPMGLNSVGRNTLITPTDTAFDTYFVAQIIRSNANAANGIVHVIDAVLA